MTTGRIHPTAIVEADVEIGEGTWVWDNAHLRSGARIGKRCIVGGKAYVGPAAVIGDCCKLNAMVYIPTGVTLRRGVMIGAGAVFTNDRYPRATDPDLQDLRPSAAGEHTEATLVREGASIGARAVIGGNLVIGRWAMVGMGAVVTRSVPDHHLVAGNPARPIGLVCRCGHRLVDPVAPTVRQARTPPLRDEPRDLLCEGCGSTALWDGEQILESRDLLEAGGHRSLPGRPQGLPARIEPIENG